MSSNTNKHIGRVVRVFWENDDDWFHGVIDEYRSDQGYHVQYYDGDEEWVMDIDNTAIIQFEDNAPVVDDDNNNNTSAAGGGGDSGFDDGVEQVIDMGDMDILANTTMKNSDDQEQAQEEQVEEEERETESQQDRNLLDDEDEEDTAPAPAPASAFDSLLSMDVDTNTASERWARPPLGASAAAAASAVATSIHENDEDKRQHRSDIDYGYGGAEGEQGQRQSVILREELYDDAEDIEDDKWALPVRGVLLMGTVTGASHVPSPLQHANHNDGNSNVDGDGDGDGGSGGGGRVFFKVLYVEGGSSNTMFRCKTPIYTSQQAIDSTFPTWNKGSFRFEMILPEFKNNSGGYAGAGARRSGVDDAGSSSHAEGRGGRAENKKLPPSVRANIKAQAAKAAKDTSKSQIQGEHSADLASAAFIVRGEIIVAVYRSRTQGGNEFIGQSVFDLTELSTSGTTTFPKGKAARGIQVRTTTGSFPVVTRTGIVAGDGLCHINLHMELAWKPDPKYFPNVNNGNGNGNVNINNNTNETILSIKNDSGPTADAAAVLSPTKKKIGVVRKVGVEKGLNGLVKQMTYNAKKNILEQHRIAKENNILATRIKAHNIKGINKHISVLPAEDVYLKPPNDKFTPQNAEEEVAHIFAKKASRLDHAELMDLYNDLKRDNSKRQKNIIEIQARITRYKAHTKKYTLSIEKIKQKLGIENSIEVDTKNALEKLNNHMSNLKFPKFAPEVPFSIGSDKGGASYEAQAKSTSLSANRIGTSTSKGTLSYKDTSDTYADAASVMKRLQSNNSQQEAKAEKKIGQSPRSYQIAMTINDSKSDDLELRELAMEHEGLQQARRGLIQRIAYAHTACVANSAALLDAQEREAMARQRLGSAFSNMGNKYAGGATYNKTQAPGADTSSGTYIKSAAELKSEADQREKEAHMDDDLQAIERVRGAQLELDRTIAFYESGSHKGALNDAIAELCGAENALKKMLLNVNSEIELLQTKRNGDLLRLRSTNNAQATTVLRLRDNISYHRERLVKLIRSERLAIAERDADNIELEALRIQLRRQEGLTQKALGQ